MTALVVVAPAAAYAAKGGGGSHGGHGGSTSDPYAGAAILIFVLALFVLAGAAGSLFDKWLKSRCRHK